MLMTGLSIEHPIVARDRGAAPVLLEARGLTRAGRIRRCLASPLRRGEVLGLTGLLGAGRTELALTLFGMTRPDARRDHGRPASRCACARNRDALRAGIAYVSEDRLNLGLNLRQSIEDNLMLAVLDRLRGASGLLSAARRRGRGVRMGAAAGDQDPRPRPTGADPVGRQPAARGAGASGWRRAPKVLILDSPTVGVDIGNKQGIYDIVRSPRR